jgi:hypothetical protein
MTRYRTIVVHVSASPLGLSPERWILDHWCHACHQRVPTDELITHAREHATTDDQQTNP